MDGTKLWLIPRLGDGLQLLLLCVLDQALHHNTNM